MKRIESIFILVLLSAIYAIPGISQESKKETVEFRVEGVCTMCKARIENAAYIKGVKFTEWNKETNIIKVIYNPQKVDLKSIHKSIADAGHSTDKIKATEESYNKLPKCCAYNNGAVKH
jgi:periplasmic mercuric ion binding protein